MLPLIIVLLFKFFQFGCLESVLDVYKYTAEVTAKVYQPLQYESSSKVSGVLYVQNENKGKNSISYLIKLQDIIISEYIGPTKDKEQEESMYTPKDIELLEEPFLVIYGKDGQFQGIKFLNKDSSWSKNVKLSIASAFQFDSKMAKKSKSNVSYFKDENTIHGNCRVSNDLVISSNAKINKKHILLNKNYVPKYCSEYTRDMFDIAFDPCFRPLADDNISSVNKKFEIQLQGSSAKLMKYEGVEIETQMPYLHKSDGLVITTNQTMVYLNSIAKEGISQAIFEEEPLIHDLIYDKATTYVADGARGDITQGRHNFREGNVTKIIEHLKASYSYLNSDRFIKQDPDETNGNNINKILDALLFFDYNSTKKVWNELNEQNRTEEIIFMRKSYLDVLCYVGTDASAKTIRDAIESNEITVTEATDVLAKFPQYILEAKESILDDMQVLLHLKAKIPHDTKKACILAFASLVHRTYTNQTLLNVPDRLEKYLQYFNSKLKDAIKDNDNEMILVYIMAFQNIKFGNIERFLWPILRKEVKIKEDYDRIRVATAFAIFNGISHNHELVHNVFFPIFVDKNEYMPLRVASFLRLMYVTQLNNQTRPMEMFWQYVSQENPIIRNLLSSHMLTHINFGTTCRQTIREMYEKIVRFIELSKANFTMPSVRFIDYSIDEYAFGEAMIEFIFQMNEKTGLSDIGAFVYNIADGRKPGPFVQAYWLYDRLDDIILDGLKYFSKESEDIEKLLAEYKSKSSNNSTLTLIPFYGFQAIQVLYYDKNSSKDKKEQLWKDIFDSINFSTIFYGKFRESTAGTGMGVPNYFRHHEPTLLSSKAKFNAKLEGTTVNIKYDFLINTWSDDLYDLSIYNTISDTFHQVRRSTYINVIMPINLLEFSYDLEAKKLKILITESSNSSDTKSKLSTYSKVYASLHTNSGKCQEKCTKTVSKGNETRKTFQSIFKSNLTSVGYNLNIYDCETGFNPDVDMQEWIEAVYNPDRNNLFGPRVEEFLVAKQKLVIDTISPRPGICGVLKEFFPTNKNLSYIVEL